jgi:hypothetical protein
VRPRKKLKLKFMRAATIGLIGCAVLIILAWIATLIWVVVRLVS